MKKICIIMAGLAVLLGSASCNKVDDKEVKTPDVKIEINVAELGTTTKAVKSGWENGDVINVYLSDATSYVPDFTLTYDGSTWVASELTDEVVARLETTGTIKGFWEASNIAATTGGDWDRYNNYIVFNHEYEESAGVKDYLTAYFSAYYLYEDGKLSAEISDWKFPNGLMQIVVTGLEHDEFCMIQSNIQVFNLYDITDDEIFPSRYAVTRIAGVDNEDGLAFVGCLNSSVYKNANFTISLFDLRDGNKEYVFAKTLQSDLYDYQSASIYAIKIPFSKFAPKEE